MRVRSVAPTQGELPGIRDGQIKRGTRAGLERPLAGEGVLAAVRRLEGAGHA